MKEHISINYNRNKTTDLCRKIAIRWILINSPEVAKFNSTGLFRHQRGDLVKIHLVAQRSVMVIGHDSEVKHRRTNVQNILHTVGNKFTTLKSWILKLDSRELVAQSLYFNHGKFVVVQTKMKKESKLSLDLI